MLPQSNIDLSRGVVFQDQPSLTWIADPVTNRLRGTDPGYAASELRRRLEDAFLPDNRILGIKDYAYTFRDVSLTVTFTALTVFGDVPGSMEAALA